MKLLTLLFKILTITFTFAAVTVIVLACIGIVKGSTNPLAAWGRIQEAFNPFNIGNYIFIAFVCLPGAICGLIWEKLKKKTPSTMTTTDY